MMGQAGDVAVCSGMQDEGRRVRIVLIQQHKHTLSYPKSMTSHWCFKGRKMPRDGVVCNSKWERQKVSNFSRSAASSGEVREPQHSVRAFDMVLLTATMCCSVVAA